MRRKTSRHAADLAPHLYQAWVEFCHGFSYVSSMLFQGTCVHPAFILRPSCVHPAFILVFEYGAIIGKNLNISTLRLSVL